MICPILTKQINYDDEINKDSETLMVWVQCQKAKCQWWTQGNCVVNEIARSMQNLNSEIYKGFEKLIDHSYHRKYRP